MTKETVLQRISDTGIRKERDFAVPINGQTFPLPYLVIRSKDTVIGSDNGNVCLIRTDWEIPLFSANRALDLEQKLQKALLGVGKMEIIPYPDGTVYQTTFKFSTTQTMQ